MFIHLFSSSCDSRSLSIDEFQLVPELLWDLCSGPLPPEEQLDRKQSLARQLARLVDFVLDFDAAKVR